MNARLGIAGLGFALLVTAGCGSGGGGFRFFPADLGGCDGGCPCTADNQCNVMAPRCDKNSGACVQCLPQNDNCPLGKKCVNTVCVARCDKDADCPKGENPVSCCNNACVDTAADVSNCGACGMACPMPASATAACAAGKCGLGSCNAGHADCDMDAANGCEIDTGADAKNCGMCGAACTAGPNQTNACAKGMCEPMCAAGFAHCSGNPGDGCEANINTSTAHCGACGKACPVPANGMATCSNGQCGVGSCDNNFADCNKQPNDGCEANLDSVQNCGACGNLCGQPANATAGCMNGQCGIGSCNAGFGDCNGAGFDGCESNLRSDIFHCGACNQQCALPNANPSCSNGQCGIAQCNVGYGNCNNIPGDGCESNANTDPMNCGFCGNRCPVNQSCVAGVCKVASYLPVGVQLNVAANTVANGGWIECYRDLYSNGGTTLQSILNKCVGSRLMLACSTVASPQNLLVLAQAPRADVIFPVGAGAGAVHAANSVNWYYDTQSSWGFAGAGEIVTRNSCDTTAGANRICWHTSGSAINGGYRCGNTTGLNASAAYNRVIYQLP